ncbi:MAG: GntR family transcriptional regulator [Pseudomonadota bacterium]
MDITIDIDDPEPLFAQLISQIKAGVQSGGLKPGQAMPSIRQLAGDLELNSKTVAKAYRLLERDEVIQTRGYRGTFIHPEATRNSEIDLAAWVKEQLAECVGEFRRAGVTDSEIRIAFGEIMNERS